MKNFVAIFLASLSSVCLAQKYIHPVFDRTDNSPFHLDSVEITKDSTFLFFTYEAEDGSWANISDSTYIEDVFNKRGIPFVTCTTWTTDAFYRETPDRIAKRKEMGAICVEMECAPMQALCDFRGIEYFQFLYAGDSLDHSNWDPRSLSGTDRLDDKEKIALLAFELALKIEK